MARWTPRVFMEVIGGVISRAAESGRPVRVFGEMVSLLVADGHPAAALRLEELWNDLQAHLAHAFSLFCAYPMDHFGGEAHQELFSDVCAAHSQVVPAESYMALPTANERLRAIAGLQQKAESLETEIAERQRAEERLRRALRPSTRPAWTPKPRYTCGTSSCRLRRTS